MHGIYERLGVPDDADARAIRKAYAHKLKAIDQQNDLEGFQQLRQAYELAMYLLEQPFQQELERATQESPEVTAKETFEYFLAATAQLSVRDIAPWREALNQHMASEQMINLATRRQFESLIVSHLATGWRPGSDMLFPAACQVFGWTNDSRRLLQFGEAGQLLDQAIYEQQAFNALPQKEIEPLLAAISRMRAPRAPTTEELRHYNLPINRLRQRYPSLIYVMLDRETFQHWLLALEKAPSLWQAPTSPKEDSWLQNLLYGLVVIAVIIYSLR
jgi:hypothetical protein